MELNPVSILTHETQILTMVRRQDVLFSSSNKDSVQSQSPATAVRCSTNQAYLIAKVTIHMNFGPRDGHLAAAAAATQEVMSSMSTSPMLI